MGFGERLRAARERRGFTQQQISDLMNIDKSTYCGYETGKRQPDVNKLKQLSKILGVSGDELLETGFAKEKAPATDGERSVDVLEEVDIAFYGDYKELSDDDKETVRDMVRIMRERRSKKQE